MLRLWCLGRLIPSSEFSVLVCEVCANIAAFTAHMSVLEGLRAWMKGLRLLLKRTPVSGARCYIWFRIAWTCEGQHFFWSPKFPNHML